MMPIGLMGVTTYANMNVMIRPYFTYHMIPASDPKHKDMSYYVVYMIYKHIKRPTGAPLTWVVEVVVVVGGGGWWWVEGGGGRPLENTGDHKGQFPRTDFGLVLATSSSTNTAKTPKATLVYGKTTFLDTHRHSHLVFEISRKCPIVCGCPELKKDSLKTQCLDLQPMYF